MRSGKDQVRARQGYEGSEKGPQRLQGQTGSGKSREGRTRVRQGSCRPKKVNVRVR